MRVIDIAVNTNHAIAEQLLGYSMREIAGAAAVVRLRKAAVGGQIMDTISLSANESKTYDWFRLFPAEGGVFVQLVSGAIEGVLLY